MEKTRKDFHITTMQHAWKVERDLAKLQYKKALENIDKQQKDAVAKATASYEKQVAEIKTDHELRRDHELYVLNQRLEDVARKQDEYMDEFRNYIANLPEADRLAYAEERRQG